MHVTLLYLFLTLVSCAFAGASGKGESEANLMVLGYPVVAYVLESKKDVATTYLVACPKDVGTQKCDFRQPYTLTEGPKTARWNYVAKTDGQEQRLTLACELEGKTSMECTATGTIGDGKATTQSFVSTGSAAAALFRNVAVVTDSASLLTYTPGPSYATETKKAETTTEKPVITPPPTKETSKTPTKTESSDCSTSTPKVIIKTVTESHSPSHTKSSSVASSSTSSPVATKSQTTSSRSLSISTTSSTADRTTPTPVVVPTGNGASPDFKGRSGIVVGGMAVLAVVVAGL